jgi:hypothetical protein
MKRTDFDRIRPALDEAIGQPLDSNALSHIADELHKGQTLSSCTFAYIVGNRTLQATGYGSDNAYLTTPTDLLVICDEQEIIRQVLCFDHEGSTQDVRQISYARRSKDGIGSLTF